MRARLKDCLLGEEEDDKCRPCVLEDGWHGRTSKSGDIGGSMCCEWEVEVRRTAIDARRKYALSARSGRRGWGNVCIVLRWRQLNGGCEGGWWAAREGARNGSSSRSV